MKTYLVTGCAGFIGSNFVHYMLEKYQDIRLVNLDKLTYAGNLENLEDIKDDARHIFVKGDICDKALAKHAPYSCACIHFFRSAESAIMYVYKVSETVGTPPVRCRCKQNRRIPPHGHSLFLQPA